MVIAPTPKVDLEIRRSSVDLNQFIEELRKENERLDKENAVLRERLNQNFNNSSKPPSTSQFNKPKSLREKSGKKPGGQPGHKGETLKLSENPDKIIEYTIDNCTYCGADLSKTKASGFKTRQVVDIIIKKVITDHRVEYKCCPKCDLEITADFPETIDHYLQYGSVYTSIMTCLNKCHYVPFDRLARFSKDAFGIPVSTGTLVNVVNNCANNLTDAMELVKYALIKSKVLNVDETGTRINGKNFWLHTAGNETLTFVGIHQKRGTEAMDANGVIPNFKGTMVHDGFKPYNKYTDCLHALCNAHLLRELNGIIDNNKQEWAKQMKELLIEIKKDVDKNNGMLDEKTSSTYEQKYDEIIVLGNSEEPTPLKFLMNEPPKGKTPQSKSRNLLDRFIQYKVDILRFMRNQEVPFDNNQAERDIRMIKVQNKVSGGFRSSGGADTFASIFSYCSTARKHGFSVFNAICDAINKKPFIPKIPQDAE